MSVALLLLLLLLGLGFVEAEGRCVFNRAQEHCVCYHLSQETVSSIIQCLAASVVEFRGGELERYVAFPISDLDPSAIEMLGSLVIRKIILVDLLVPEILLARVLRFFSYTQVRELVFESCVFEGRGNWEEMANQDLPILSLGFHNVTSAPLTGHEQEFSHLSSWLGTLQELSVTASHVTSLPCGIGKVFRALRSLDMAQNSLEEESLVSAFCSEAFPQLQVLSLQRNRLRSYHDVCESLQPLHGLQHLDLSQNKLMADPSSGWLSCQWPASLRIFNLSDTGLDEVLAPLPPNLEVLDLSCNHLHAVDISLRSLKKLFLSQNMLQAAPSIQNYPMLDTLHLDNNRLPKLPWGEVKHLQDVSAAGNPYDCSCSAATGLQALAATGHLGQGWPQDYVCHSPPDYRGRLVEEVPVSVLRCKSAAVIAPVCVVLALLVVAGA
ncbi:TLR21 protein, partial [Pedionomus torquatus]|nr:TLR21 protein [Pedionomus torquatus]